MSKKEAIIQAATHLFSRKGFKDTRMLEISTLTGAAEGTIFYHFKNKEELFLYILEKFKKDITDEFELYIRENEFKNGLDMIEKTVAFYLDLAGTMEDRFLLLHRHDAYELAEANPVCRGYLNTIYTCLLNIFERAVLRGQNDGSIRDMPAKKASLIVLSMVDGLVRLNTYNLYHADALYGELIESVRRMLQKS
ncbi:MAG: TetR/AcrR family transcriptional regulator [Deltaproteobacteria bacterium]|nr:TetR/AcrR family transcriptional regulator [Deltaproteobacteria bacterium]